MAQCLIALGANLGDRARTLSHAASGLAAMPGVSNFAESHWYETAPVGGPAGQPAFLNGAVRLTTSQSPFEILAALEQLEASAGRAREVRWDARTLDLDLLLFDDLCLDTPQLTLPHPRMAFRRFVLRPAAEVAATMVHPTIGWTLEQLLVHLETAPEYVAIAGPMGAGKTWLAKELHARLPGHLLLEALDDERLTTFYADPISQAWSTELELLHERQQLLSPARLDAAAEQFSGGLIVSDFWFDQGLAFASAWLSEEQFDDYLRAWNIARQGVVQPKLLLELRYDDDAELAARVARRGRPYERQLSLEQSLRLRLALQTRTELPGLGPVLRLNPANPAATVAEAVAAIEAMR